MSVRDKWVRRFSVDETAKHKKGFTIYKITSVLFLLKSPEAMTVVSVWKRYSDVQRLHKTMSSLHAGLHLGGSFPSLPKSSFFKRFQTEIIEERAKAIKTLMEFVAEHRLLFTSTDFVNFLQSGYPEPGQGPGGVINAIRSSLQLPIEDTPPLEYQTSDEDTRSPTHSARSVPETPSEGIPNLPIDRQTDIDVSQIPIYEAANVEIRPEPRTRLESTSSSESFESIGSLDSDLYDELSKIKIDKPVPLVKSKTMLPDLIIFDAPSTSKFDDYHTMPRTSNEDNASLASTTHSFQPGNTDADSLTSVYNYNVPRTSNTDDTRSLATIYDGESRSSSRMSQSQKSAYPKFDSKTRTEDSYVFEAGYMVNLAARAEDMNDYQMAFDYYKSAIEIMLVGVHDDTNYSRRGLIKQKITKYMSHAEDIYNNHLKDNELNQGGVPSVSSSARNTSRVPPQLVEAGGARRVHCALPAGMVRRGADELGAYRVLAPRARLLLAHRPPATACVALKVIQKIPHNLTEVDDYYMQSTNETHQPILPTVIPYMVQLHAFIETDNLIFLVLSYAPGERLFDYIKNYAKSAPHTPAREVNLENVFTDPKSKSQVSDLENDNIDVGVDAVDSKVERLDNVKTDIDSCDNIDVSVNELVMNSQKLLLNVDKALCSVPSVEEEGGSVGVKSEVRDVVREETTVRRQLTVRPWEILPPLAVCRWGAEILTALESLHNYGVICRDLNPSNILLGEQGQVILTYFLDYPDSDVGVSRLLARPPSLYVAPELYCVCCGPRDRALQRAGDYWSFGALMYELLCGVPLSHYHRTVFTSHTILQLPDGLPVEVQSLLTQLLTYEPSARLGAGSDGIDEIKQHPYFRHIDWQDVYDSWAVPG